MRDTKKAIILDAATKVFAQQGYQYATISAIAGEAGISTGLLYSYFENKLDVLLSIIVSFWKKINAVNREALAGVRHPQEKLHIILHNFEQLLTVDQHALYLVKVLNEGLPHIVMIKRKNLQQKRREIIDENKRLIDMIDAVMVEGQEQGVFDDSLNPCVLRQILCASVERVTYGLFFKGHYSGHDIGYDRKDAHQAMMMLIDKFIQKGSRMQAQGTRPGVG